MPLLPNNKRELFAQGLAMGRSQGKAYAAAGFAPDDGHACRMANEPEIVARVQELLEASARHAAVLVADIAEQLDEDRTFARDLKQPGAAVSATMGKAKVLGLLSEKVEHTGANGGPIELGDSELARLIVFQLQKAAKAGDQG